MIWKIKHYSGNQDPIVSYMRSDKKPTPARETGCRVVVEDFPVVAVEALEHIVDVTALTPEEVFNLYCDHEGLIAYGPKLWNLIKELQ